MAQAFLSKRAERIQPELESVELTILMPCLNERATVAACVRKAQGFLGSHGINGEVLVADNGSVDGSQFIANAAGARVIEVFDRGYGAALMAGIRSARGKFIIMGDADASYDFEDLGGLLASLREGRDMIVGNRFVGGIEAGAMPFLHRYVGNPVLSFLGRTLFSVPIGDFHCGLRGFSADAVRGLRLTAPGMEFASEMIVKAALAGLVIGETPVALSRDGREGPSHLRTWSDGWRHLRFLLAYSPRWLFGYPGLLLILIGLLGTGWLSYQGPAAAQNSFAQVLALAATASMILVGANLLALGVLARRSAMIEGILPPRTRLHHALGRLSLETVLKSGLLAMLVGVGCAAWAIGQLMVGDIATADRAFASTTLVLSITIVAVAVQTAAAAFFAAMPALCRGP